jgi:hypothetical protein
MPGLIRGVARTAAIAGTATAVSNRVSRRQGQKWSQQEQQQYEQQQAAAQQAAPQQAAPPQVVYVATPPADAPPEMPAADRLAALKDLGELKAAGVLTEAEFAAEKARILAS